MELKQFYTTMLQYSIAIQINNQKINKNVTQEVILNLMKVC